MCFKWSMEQWQPDKQEEYFHKDEKKKKIVHMIHESINDKSRNQDGSVSGEVPGLLYWERNNFLVSWFHS